MTEVSSEVQKPDCEKITLKVIIIAVVACIIFGFFAGFRSNIPVIIGIINSVSETISYTDLQLANSVCRFVSALASPVIAFLTLKKSNQFVLTFGFVLTCAGVICMSLADSFILLLLGLGILFALGGAALSFGIIFGIVSPLVGEKVAIVLSTVFTLAGTFFGVVFSPLIQYLSNILGYQAMLAIFCILIISIYPLVFLISGKKHDADIAKQKKAIRFKEALGIILKNKVTYILIVFFFIIGFTQGIGNHFYTGMLSLDVPSMIVSYSYSLLKVVMTVGSLVLTFVVLKIKRTIAFGALIFLLFGINELAIALLPKENLIFLPFVYLSVFICSSLYPLANLIVRREYAPILIGSVICFISFF